MESQEVHDFGGATPEEFRFTYDKRSYVLREPTEDLAIKYRNRQAQSVKMSRDKTTEIGDIGQLHSYLLSLCVFEVVGDEEKPVSFAELSRWRSKVVRQLHERAVAMGDLSEDEEKREASLKNGRSGSETTSPSPSTSG